MVAPGAPFAPHPHSQGLGSVDGALKVVGLILAADLLLFASEYVQVRKAATGRDGGAVQEGCGGCKRAWGRGTPCDCLCCEGLRLGCKGKRVCVGGGESG